MNELDKKANRLLLKPRKKQTNSWGKSFKIDPPCTDIDIVRGERMALCVRLRNGERR